ncbi:MAG: NAD(+) synthase [Pseudoflavonifractor sp.]|nr:NAD(+) synthase [Pseudoflavonifractor sp.]
MRNGYMRVAAVAPRVNVADVEFNVSQIASSLTDLAGQGVRVAVFPEMCVTAYTCADLFHSATLLDAAADGVMRLARLTADMPVLVIIGAPVLVEGTLYNCAVALCRGDVVAIVPKTYIPNYNEFYEKRWWGGMPVVNSMPDAVGYCGRVVPFGTDVLVEIDGVKVGMEICEDLWSPIPPSTRASLAGAEIVVNLSASDDLIGKYSYLTDLIRQQSARAICAYLYAGAGYGESSTDLVFDGKTIIAENGTLLARNDRWSHGASVVVADIDIAAIRRDRLHITTFADCRNRELPAPYRVIAVADSEVSGCKGMTPGDGKIKRYIDPHPFVPADDARIDERCEEIINIQSAGLARRLEFTHTKTLVVGISGGLDSTLALLVAARTFDRLGLDRVGIIGVTMPGFGTTDRTYNNALTLMRELGVTIREISIVPAVRQHFADIGHDPAVHDVTYENSQARERTQLLMDIANQAGGMVLGTGDLSELALGWATYNGDHMSMYGVNAGVPKTLVKYLVRWFAMRAAAPGERDALLDIIDTPISPELIPADEQGNIKQKTEDLVGPYELHDFVLYYVLRYGFSPKRIYAMAMQAFDGVYDAATIKHWMRTFYRRFFNQQFKRSCLPDGPKVGSVCLSPRGDWRMPSDASSALWLRECDNL